MFLLVLLIPHDANQLHTHPDLKYVLCSCWFIQYPWFFGLQLWTYSLLGRPCNSHLIQFARSICGGCRGRKHLYIIENWSTYIYVTLERMSHEWKKKITCLSSQHSHTNRVYVINGFVHWQTNVSQEKCAKTLNCLFWSEWNGNMPNAFIINIQIT